MMSPTNLHSLVFLNLVIVGEIHVWIYSIKGVAEGEFMLNLHEISNWSYMKN